MLIRPTVKDDEGVLRKGTTCFFRNVELDYTVLSLIEDGASVWIHGDSVGCQSWSFATLAGTMDLSLHIVASDPRMECWYPHPMVRRLQDTLEDWQNDFHWDVVYATNCIGYAPQDRLNDIVEQLAWGCRGYLVVTHIDRKLLEPHFEPVTLNQDAIKRNWRHPAKAVQAEECFLYRRRL